MYPKKQYLETEVKFCITNLSKVEKKLIKAGAILHQPKTKEYNLRFDTPGLDLTRNKKALRLRRDNRVRLTFKGPAEWQGGISTRQEIEFTVGDFESAKKLVQSLGYQINVIYEKYRTTYILNDLIITLDELPYGLFIEIEGADFNNIQKCAEDIGLRWETRLKESYLTLFDRVKKSMGLSFRDLTFENFAQVELDLNMLGINPADK